MSTIEERVAEAAAPAIALIRELEGYRSEIRGLRDEIKGLHGEIDSLRDEAEELQDEIEDLQDKNEELKDKNTGLHLENTRLKQLLREVGSFTVQVTDNNSPLTPEDVKEWGKSLTERVIALSGEPFELRKREPHKDPKACPFCKVPEGHHHKWDCEYEPCPFCTGYLTGCDCRYEEMGIPVDRNLPMNGMPEDIWENGLPPELEEAWKKKVEEKGRIPWIQWPSVCRRCGKLWPDMFMVPDEEWEKYIEPAKQEKVVCAGCYNEIRELIRKGTSRAERD